VSPTHQDLSNDTTFSQIKSRVPVPLKGNSHEILNFKYFVETPPGLFIDNYILSVGR